MRRIIIGALTIILISGCADKKKKYEHLASQQLKDPSSAIFSNVKMINFKTSSEFGICGYVNGKNSYGGYTGKKEFVFIAKSNKIFKENTLLIDGDDTASDPDAIHPNDAHLVESTLWTAYCEDPNSTISADEAKRVEDLRNGVEKMLLVSG